jgi:hypothetical protein
MSHNNGGVKNLGEKYVSESKKFPPYDDESGVGLPYLKNKLLQMKEKLSRCSK